MKRWLLTFALLSAPLSALAQSPEVTGALPYSGNPIGTGLALTGPLFVTGSAPLSLNYPFSCSMWVKGTTIASAQHQLCSSGVYPNGGVFILTGGPDYNGYGTASLQVLTNPGGATNSRCDNGGQPLCARSTLLSDGNWHHICVSMSATQSSIYIDAILRDQNNTGTLTAATNKCPDGSGNNNPLILDTGTPTVAITTPSAGPVSGSVSLTGSCSDLIACGTITWLVDGVSVGTATTSPYTLAWDSTKWLDGSHTITMSATNFGGVTGTATVAVTRSNGVTAKTVYVSTSGTDAASPTCLSSSTPCQTLAYVTNPTNYVYYGGDTLALKAGDNFSCGGGCLSLRGSGGFFGGTRNAYGAGANAPITVTTWNGGTCAPIANTVSGCATLTLTSPMGAGGNNSNCIVEVSNVNNVTIKNLVIIGTGQATAQTSYNGAICDVPQGQTTMGFTATNNRVVDVWGGITVTGNFAYLSAGSPDYSTITDNDVHGSTTAAVLANGIASFGTAAKYGQWTIQGNLVYNIGTDTMLCARSDCGGGIISSHHYGSVTGYGYVDQFNVIHDGGYNNVHCGGPLADWQFQVVNYTVQFNEAYNQGLGSTAGCDNGAWDLDGGVSYTIVQYNYDHTNRSYSGGAGLPSGTTGNYALFQAGYTSLRYQISENNYGGCGDQTCSPFAVGSGLWGIFGLAPIGPSHVYNNTYYSSKNGSVPPWGGCCVRFVGAALQPPTCSFPGSYIANNVIAMNQSGYGYTRFAGGYGSGACTSGSAAPSFKANAWVNLSAPGVTSVQWYWTPGGTTPTTLSGWQAIVPGGDTNATTASPNFASAGTGGTCWNGTSIPNGPQTSAGCPAGYQLTSSSRGSYEGVGFDMTTTLATTGQTMGARDYYGNAIPGGTGTGYNIGADGAYR